MSLIIHKCVQYIGYLLKRFLQFISSTKKNISIHKNNFSVFISQTEPNIIPLNLLLLKLEPVIFCVWLLLLLLLLFLFISWFIFSCTKSTPIVSYRIVRSLLCETSWIDNNNRLCLMCSAKKHVSVTLCRHLYRLSRQCSPNYCCSIDIDRLASVFYDHTHCCRLYIKTHKVVVQRRQFSTQYWFIFFLLNIRAKQTHTHKMQWKKNL